MNKQELIEKIEARNVCDLAVSDSFKNGFNTMKGIAVDLASELDEPNKPQSEKVEVPNYVAEWFESRYHINQDIYNLLFKGNMLNDNSLTKFEKWFYSDPINNFETLIRMKEGYTVNPKRWVVRTSSAYFEQFSGDSNHPFNFDATHNICVALTFTDKSKAEAVAVLVEGSVEEV